MMFMSSWDLCDGLGIKYNWSTDPALYFIPDFQIELDLTLEVLSLQFILFPVIWYKEYVFNVWWSNTLTLDEFLA